MALTFSSPRVLAALVTTVALSLSACGGDTASETTSAAITGEFITENDYVMGQADAPVTIVEYASVVCGHCANWHMNVYPEFKAKYVDTGQVKYVFRNLPTQPFDLADTGHKIAMCASRENYFKNIKLQFDRQSQILDMARKNLTREAYVGLAKASGLSEDEFIACIQDPEVDAKYKATVQSANDYGVSGTPSFVINGKLVKKAPSGAQVFSLESFDEVLAPLLGLELPETDDSTENATEGAAE